MAPIPMQRKRKKPRPFFGAERPRKKPIQHKSIFIKVSCLQSAWWRKRSVTQQIFFIRGHPFSVVIFSFFHLTMMQEAFQESSDRSCNFFRKYQEMRTHPQQGFLTFRQPDQLQQPSPLSWIAPFFFQVRRKPDTAFHCVRFGPTETGLSDLLKQLFGRMKIGPGKKPGSKLIRPMMLS